MSTLPQVVSFDFCWLVELFFQYDGNSRGFYAAGGGQPTQDPNAAVRYATAKDAAYVASKLPKEWSGEWRAVEHGFASAVSPTHDVAELLRANEQLHAHGTRMFARLEYLSGQMHGLAEKWRRTANIDALQATDVAPHHIVNRMRSCADELETLIATASKESES